MAAACCFSFADAGFCRLADQLLEEALHLLSRGHQRVLLLDQGAPRYRHLFGFTLLGRKVVSDARLPRGHQW